MKICHWSDQKSLSNDWIDVHLPFEMVFLYIKKSFSCGLWYFLCNRIQMDFKIICINQSKLVYSGDLSGTIIATKGASPQINLDTFDSGLHWMSSLSSDIILSWDFRLRHQSKFSRVSIIQNIIEKNCMTHVGWNFCVLHNWKLISWHWKVGWWGGGGLPLSFLHIWRGRQDPLWEFWGAPAV